METNTIAKKQTKNSHGRVIALILCVAIIAAVAVILVLNQHGEYIVLDDTQLSEVTAANTELNDIQQTLVDSALSLRGKVHYFWGGKSGAIGWDDDWGTPRIVESEGSESSGTEKPYGLDCSGYVAWCHVQLGYSLKEVGDKLGLGTWYQWDASREIAWDELLVGDIAFMNRYPTNEGNHIGLCVGFYKQQPVFAHCSSSLDTVVVSTAGDVFKYARRTSYLE